MTNYTDLLGPRRAPPGQRHASTTTPQYQVLKGRAAEMKRNAEGGFVFSTDDETTLRRFLVLGTTAGTYYASSEQLSADALEVVDRMLVQDAKRVVDIIVEVSLSGAPLKQSPCIFALARACSFVSGDPKRDCDNGDPVTVGRAYALAKAPVVLRTFQHVFEFLDYTTRQRGKGGSGLKTMLGRILTQGEVRDLEYQALKYRDREGFTPRDLLRLAHAKPGSTERDNLMGWIAKAESEKGRAAVASSARLAAFEELRAGVSVERAAQLITDQRLTHEFVPNELLGHQEIWAALLPNLPLTALTRNLRKMTQVGLLKDGKSEAVKLVRDKLTNVEALRRARLHPLRIMGARAAYSTGTSRYGHGSDFIPSSAVLSVLDDALELSWRAVEPLNKRTVIGVDKSGSMSQQSPMAGLSAFHACLALATWYKRTEVECHVILFDHSPELLNVSNKVTWSEMMRMSNPSGSTDTSAPLRWITANKIDPELIVTMTDNETWAGKTHYVEELGRIRQRVSHPVANVIAAVTATSSTVADPNDPHHLEVVGFDPTVPEAIAAHVKEVFR